jgi:hypothetical protein
VSDSIQPPDDRIAVVAADHTNGDLARRRRALVDLCGSEIACAESTSTCSSPSERHQNVCPLIIWF